MSDNIQISSNGVKKALRKFKENEAIIEYIKNGFDANATEISVDFRYNALGESVGGMECISISDNGSGIDRDLLDEKFKPFFQSEKLEKLIEEKRKNSSSIHGKNGVGRLTFFKFAKNAVWNTCYASDSDNKEYSISINENDLTTYVPTLSKQSNNQTGTTVIFSNLTQHINVSTLYSEILTEFCWYLHLNKEKGFKITVDGVEIDYTSRITESETGTFKIDKDSFDWEFINWNTSLGKEYSKYYFIKNDGDEKFKQHTTFNNKGDKFYHSLFVKSSFFDNFTPEKDDGQISLWESQNQVFRELKRKLDAKILEKRTPYIRKYTQKVIDEFEKAQAFSYLNGQSCVDKFKRKTLEDFIRELYVINTKLFSQLNADQKRTFVRLLDSLLLNNNNDSLFTILDSILDMSEADKTNLANILQHTTMQNITRTIDLIQSRLKSIEYFRKAVYDTNLEANEVDHLQKLLEENFWLFGEQYALVACAEDNFVKLTQKHLQTILRKDDGDENSSALEEIKKHPNRQEQVDLCCTRQMVDSNEIGNIIVEIKHPLKTLTMEHYNQVRKYMQTITSVPEFNAENYKWTFFLIGTKFSKYVKDEIANLRHKGKQHLVFSNDDYTVEIYARTWESIFNDYKIKYDTLHKRLDMQLKSMASPPNQIDELIDEQKKLITK